MRFILFQLLTEAHIARMIMATTTVAADQSSTDLGQNAIQAASTQNKWLFVLYMVCIVGAAVLTYLLWQSGNKVQDVIMADANARIGGACQRV
jgi:hypothetical protein